MAKRPGGEDLARVARLIAGTFEPLLPPGQWGVRVGPGRDDLGSLTATERELTRRMSPQRASQFAAGRREARAACSRLGYPGLSILRHADGAPHWPAPLQGSISHGGGLTAVVVSCNPALRGVGIDLEAMARPFPAGVGELVFAPGELPPHGSCQSRPFQLFSAKEATMKAVRQATGQRPGWEEIQIMEGFQGGQFTPEIFSPNQPGGYAVFGRAVAAHGFSLALCALFDPASQPANTANL